MPRIWRLLALVIAGLILAGCAEGPPARQQSALTGQDLPGDFSGTGPGTLLSATALPTVDLRLKAESSLAARVTYASTSGVDDSPQTVSGTVFVPRGKAPTGGWPVIAFGHPTTGTRTECAPSLDPTLLTIAPIVTGLVKAGYLVVVSDYQGLGVSGSYHPYLEPKTAGFNLIDSVRAARKLVPDASDRWAALGGSQGGQAAWAANEVAPVYGVGLNLVGTVSFSAPLDISGIADLAAAGELSSEQRAVILAIVDSLAHENPGINLDDYRRGVAKDQWDLLLACKGFDTVRRTLVVNELTADDVRPASPAAADAMRTMLEQRALPQLPASAPMLVIYGGADSLVAAAWTDRALMRACGMGNIIQIQLQPDKGHADVDASTAFPWINDRFAGLPAPDDCPNFVLRTEELEVGQ
jgi:hypothetical protein